VSSLECLLRLCSHLHIIIYHERHSDASPIVHYIHLSIHPSMCMRRPIITTYSIYTLQYLVLLSTQLVAPFYCSCCFTLTIIPIHTPISAFDVCYSHLCRGFEASYHLWHGSTAPISQRSNKERGLDLLWPSNLPSSMTLWTGDYEARQAYGSIQSLGGHLNDRQVLTDQDKSERSDAKSLLINS